jgi:1,4-alpha-glucan branching enzyme
MKRSILFICTYFILVNLEAQQHIDKLSNPLAWMNDATIYEVNLRQYTKEGTFKEFEKHLPRLQDLGVKIIWFMPIQPIGIKNRKGTLGSYYSVKDYTAINPEFGTLAEFKNLVKKCHSMGFKLIIDWVANHTAQDNAWVKTHPDWYNFDSTGRVLPPAGTDWWDVADLNFDKPALHQEMIKSMNFWIKKCDIDGFRCDVAGSVPIEFWNKASKELNKTKPIFMLAEWEDPTAFSAFNVDYGWEFHHILHKIATGEKKLGDIDLYQTQSLERYPKSAIHMYFVTNHDENSWNGTISEKFGPLGDAFTAFAMVWGGMPLIYSGQEADLQRRLPFFEKDEIDWSNLPKNDLLKKLVNLKKINKALANGIHESIPQRIHTKADEAIYAFTRTKDDAQIIFMMNVTPNKTLVKLSGESIFTSYKNVITGESVKLNNSINEFTLPGFGYLILETHK